MNRGSFRTMKIVALPHGMDRRIFIDALLGAQFALYHDLRKRETLIAVYDTEAIETIRNALPGTAFSVLEEPLWPGKKLCIIAFPAKENADTFDAMYRFFGGSTSVLLTSFIPVSEEYVEKVKENTEEKMSQMDVRLSKSLSKRADAYSETDALQRDLYHGSDQKRALSIILESLSSAMLANGTAYKIVILINHDDIRLHSYLRSKLLILDEFEFEGDSLQVIIDELKKIDAIPHDAQRTAMMLGFSNTLKVVRAINTHVCLQSGGISLGRYLEDGVKETEHIVGISKETLNLGTLVTGVPGTGKTFAAKGILEGVVTKGNLKLVIISTTDEWNSFGNSKGSYVIKPYESKVPINFFKCDANINSERFYENLAMLLASASNAGPYKDSLEKCLLSAFYKIYRDTLAPDPVEVYDAVEEAIVEQHATKTNVGIKYTKHGENVRAALENLRLMLNRPEFAFSEGINFDLLLEKGAIFDLSSVSNKMKPFFYALILNQAYSFADSFDTSGDDSLRMLICIEEAQLIFGREEKSAATADLKQRIQDFRKKGIGLILIAHNVTDIEPNIRRLCQTKLYFRQSSDVAKFAADDLPFKEENHDAVVEILKILEHRVCALSHIENSTGIKNMADPIFIKISKQSLEGAGKSNAAIHLECEGLTKISMKIRLANEKGEPKKGVSTEVFYVGERIFKGKSDNDGFIFVENSIPGKQYNIIVLGEKKKDTRKFKVIAIKERDIIF